MTLQFLLFYSFYFINSLASYVFPDLVTSGGVCPSCLTSSMMGVCWTYGLSSWWSTSGHPFPRLVPTSVSYSSCTEASLTIIYIRFSSLPAVSTARPTVAHKLIRLRNWIRVYLKSFGFVCFRGSCTNSVRLHQNLCTEQTGNRWTS